MRRLSIYFFLFFICLSALSQDSFIPQCVIGVNSGVTHANVIFKNPINSIAVDALGFGYYLKYISEPHLGIQLEIDYSPRGWKEVGNDTIVGYERRMSFLQFPVLTSITIGSKLFRFNIELGPYIAFKKENYEGYNPHFSSAIDTMQIVNPEFQYFERTPNESGFTNFKVEDPIYKNYPRYGHDIDKKFDYGFILGAGFGFNTKAGEFGLQFRYSLGLTNIFTRYPEGEFRFSQMQNFYFGVSYNYAINLRKKVTK